MADNQVQEKGVLALTGVKMAASLMDSLGMLRNERAGTLSEEEDAELQRCAEQLDTYIQQQSEPEPVDEYKSGYDAGYRAAMLDERLERERGFLECEMGRRKVSYFTVFADRDEEYISQYTGLAFASGPKCKVMIDRTADQTTARQVLETALRYVTEHWDTMTKEREAQMDSVLKIRDYFDDDEIPF